MDSIAMNSVGSLTYPVAIFRTDFAREAPALPLANDDGKALPFVIKCEAHLLATSTFAAHLKSGGARIPARCSMFRTLFFLLFVTRLFYPNEQRAPRYAGLALEATGATLASRILIGEEV